MDVQQPPLSSGEVAPAQATPPTGLPDLTATIVVSVPVTGPLAGASTKVVAAMNRKRQGSVLIQDGSVGASASPAGPAASHAPASAAASKSKPASGKARDAIAKRKAGPGKPSAVAKSAKTASASRPRSMAEEASKTKFSRNYMQWSPEMESALLAVLVEHHNNGDHAQNGWKPHVYNGAIRVVRDQCGVVVTKEKIVSRCRTFDKHYEILSKILAQSGFGWDNEKNIMSVYSEDVWNRNVQANEKAAIYKTKVVHNWDEICIIYSKDHVTGEGARTGDETAANPLPEDKEIFLESVEPAPKRQRPCDVIMCMLGDMETSFTKALKTTEPLPMPHITSPADIFAALENIQGLSHSDKLRAYGKLIHSERMFQSLMELPTAFRKEWMLMSI